MVNSVILALYETGNFIIARLWPWFPTSYPFLYLVIRLNEYMYILSTLFLPQWCPSLHSPFSSSQIHGIFEGLFSSSSRSLCPRHKRVNRTKGFSMYIQASYIIQDSNTRTHTEIAIVGPRPCPWLYIPRGPHLASQARQAQTSTNSQGPPMLPSRLGSACQEMEMILPCLGRLLPALKVLRLNTRGGKTTTNASMPTDLSRNRREKIRKGKGCWEPWGNASLTSAFSELDAILLYKMMGRGSWLPSYTLFYSIKEYQDWKCRPKKMRQSQIQAGFPLVKRERPMSKPRRLAVNFPTILPMILMW